MGLGLGLGLPFGLSPKSFDPSVLANLAAWYRADKGVTIATGVSKWADQSGNADTMNRDAVQATPSLQPTFNASDAAFNGKASITFSGTNVKLRTGVWSTPIAQPTTVFLVAKWAHSTYALDSLADPSQFAIYNSGGSVINAFAGASDIATSSDSTSPVVVIAEFNGSSSKVYVSAHTVNTTGNLGATGATGITIANYANGGVASNATIAEIAYFSRALSQSEIDQLNTYASARYGITIGP